MKDLLEMKYFVVMIPRLIPQPKWFKTTKEVKIDDVVYFQKQENDMSSDWTMGQVDSIILGGRDLFLHQKIFFLHQTGPAGFSRFCTKIIFFPHQIRFFSTPKQFFSHQIISVN